MPQLPHYCKVKNREVWVNAGKSCPFECENKNHEFLRPQFRENFLKKYKTRMIQQFIEIEGWRANEETLEVLKDFPEYDDPDGYLIWASTNPLLVEKMDFVRVQILKDAPKDECILLLRKILNWVEEKDDNFLWHDWEVRFSK